LVVGSRSCDGRGETEARLVRVECECWRCLERWVDRVGRWDWKAWRSGVRRRMWLSVRTALLVRMDRMRCVSRFSCYAISYVC
jgi:hypothetical protein